MTLPTQPYSIEDALGGSETPVITIDPAGGHIKVPCKAGHYATVYPETEHSDVVVQGFAFLCTGEAVLPDGFKNDYLASHVPTLEDCTKYVESLVKNGVVKEEAALLALNETTAIYKNALGPHCGYLLRNFPSFSESLHPYMVAMVKMEDIPERTKENCKKVWESLPDDAKAGWKDLNQYIMVSACSATDQLNDSIVALKNKREPGMIMLMHPSLKHFQGAEIREQVFFDRSLVFPYVQVLEFMLEIIDGVMKLHLVAYMRTAQIKDALRFEVPALSFLLAKVAEETGLEADSLLISAADFINENGEEATIEDIASTLKDIGRDVLGDMKAEGFYVPYEKLVPAGSIVNYSGDAFAALTKEENHDDAEEPKTQAD